MKQFFFVITLTTTIAYAQAEENFFCKKSKPQPAVQASQQEDDDDDIDGQVVLANIANMLQSIGTLSTDPYNPAVAGPSIAQFGMGIVNIIVQMFKSMPIRGEITHEQIEQWFNNLPDATKMKLVALLLVYADCQGKRNQ